MIIIVTGAYKNIGDHLIGDRAHKPLKSHIDPDIIDIWLQQIEKTQHRYFK